MYIAQFLICAAQMCAVLETQTYVMYMDMASCEAAAEAEAQDIAVLLKDKPVEAVGFKCVDKTSSIV
jgi:hypothetical protein